MHELLNAKFTFDDMVAELRNLDNRAHHITSIVAAAGDVRKLLYDEPEVIGDVVMDIVGNQYQTDMGALYYVHRSPFLKKAKELRDIVKDNMEDEELNGPTTCAHLKILWAALDQMVGIIGACYSRITKK